jgi:hypothetical protein
VFLLSRGGSAPDACAGMTNCVSTTLNRTP